MYLQTKRCQITSCFGCSLDVTRLSCNYDLQATRTSVHEPLLPLMLLGLLLLRLAHKNWLLKESAEADDAAGTPFGSAPLLHRVVQVEQRRQDAGAHLAAAQLQQ